MKQLICLKRFKRADDPFKPEFPGRRNFIGRRIEDNTFQAEVFLKLKGYLPTANSTPNQPNVEVGVASNDHSRLQNRGG